MVLAAAAAAPSELETEMNRFAKMMGLFVLLASGCHTAHGGGWIPSQDSVAGHKATFGFSYACKNNSSGNAVVSGVFNYQDHGTGERVVGSIKENVLNPNDQSPISCEGWNATFGGDTAGVAGACGIAKNGGGGVQAGDVFFAFAVDGKATTTTQPDALGVVLIHPNEVIPPDLLQAYCGVGLIGALGDPYYVNQAALGAGNVTWAQ